MTEEQEEVWYWADGLKKRGPVSGKEIRKLASRGRVRRENLVWRAGTEGWVQAGSQTELFGPSVTDRAGTVAAAARDRAVAFASDMAGLSFRNDVFPLNAKTLSALRGDFVFWSVAVLGLTPLLIGTIDNLQTQMTTFAVFFAFVWGAVLKYLIVKPTGGWRFPVISFFMTGVMLLPMMRWCYTLIPQALLATTFSTSSFESLFGMIFLVGYPEEVLKAVPVLVYLLWKRQEVEPLSAIAIGVFAGLGFAAFENLGYRELMVGNSVAMTENAGVDGLAEGVQTAVNLALLRTFSLVLFHAVWSGITAYFLAVACLLRKRVAALVFVGITVAALLHGFHNWFQFLQPTIAIAIDLLALALFYVYLSKARVLHSFELANALPEHSNEG
jgi:RsiW-degrading membrane proteinase PrsW (M82 family)